MRKKDISGWLLSLEVFFQIGRWDGSLSVDHISFSIVEGRATAAFSLMRRWSVKKWCKENNQSRECDFLVPSCLTFNHSNNSSCKWFEFLWFVRAHVAWPLSPVDWSVKYARAEWPLVAHTALIISTLTRGQDERRQDRSETREW